MAEIVLKIPKEFEQDFNTDKFKECFERVLSDCKAWDYTGLSGNYEHETLEMLLDAFNEAVVLPKGHGRLIDADWVLNKMRTTDEQPITPNEHYAWDFAKALFKNAPTIIEANKGEC